MLKIYTDACRGGGTGRHARLRGVWGNSCEFKSRPRHHRLKEYAKTCSSQVFFLLSGIFSTFKRKKEEHPAEISKGAEKIGDMNKWGQVMYINIFHSYSFAILNFINNSIILPGCIPRNLPSFDIL